MMLPSKWMSMKKEILLQFVEEEICNFIVLYRHIGLLLEKIRREGYEFAITPP